MVLDAQVPGGVTARHLLDATADMVTARRIAARAVDRLPEDPEWDERECVWSCCAKLATGVSQPGVAQTSPAVRAGVPVVATLV